MRLRFDESANVWLGGPCRGAAGRPTNASAVGRAAQLVDGELGCGVATALGTVLDVSPRPQQPRPLRIEQHDEGLGQRVELQTEIRAPGRRRIPSVEVQSLQDAAEPQV